MAPTFVPRSAPAREAMLDSTIVSLRERSLAGTSVRDVIEHTDGGSITSTRTVIR